MINLTKLSKALQAHKGHGRTMWFKRDGVNYIATGFFILATKQDITGSASTKLLSLLGNTPKDGQGFQVTASNKSEMDPHSVETMLKLLNIEGSYRQITDTKLMVDLGDKTVRIFDTGSDYSYVDKIYTDLVDLKADGLKIISDKPTSPIYFTVGDDTAMLLPIRWQNADLDYLKAHE